VQHRDRAAELLPERYGPLGRFRERVPRRIISFSPLYVTYRRELLVDRALARHQERAVIWSDAPDGSSNP
jgi:hypothetical protein